MIFMWSVICLGSITRGFFSLREWKFYLYSNLQTEHQVFRFGLKFISSFATFFQKLLAFLRWLSLSICLVAIKIEGNEKEHLVLFLFQKWKRSCIWLWFGLKFKNFQFFNFPFFLSNQPRCGRYVYPSLVYLHDSKGLLWYFEFKWEV